MKQLFLLVCIIFCEASFAQIDIISESVNHPDSNVLFIGADNYLKLKGGNIRDYSPVADNSAEISKFDQGFFLRVFNQGNTNLKLFRNKKLVYTKMFRAETIAPMKAQLGGVADSVASVSEILANPFLHVVIPHSAYKHSFSIISFDLDIIAANDTVSKASSSNNIISETQLKVIKELHANDQLLFHNVRGICPDCAARKFPNFTITIK